MAEATAPAPAPIIVTALFGTADFAMLNGLRVRYFPPERNLVPAHLTLFHHLAPSLSREIATLLSGETRGVRAPDARLAGLVSLGGGVALRIESAELAAIRARLAHAFAAMLTPQDAAGWRPHVTVQNKVGSAVARATLAELGQGFAPRSVAIVGLASYYYRGGPWEAIAGYRFG